MSKCSVCGRERVDEALFCAFCGAEFERPKVEDDLEAEIDAAEQEFLDKVRDSLGDEYQLLEQIGSGGFARVYRARDRRLDRIVALKVMRPEFGGDPSFAERFRREGKALAKLRHPGIVPIYNIREAEDLIYYVMPFADGPNLREKLEEHGHLPPVEVHRLLLDLCDSIGAAHRAGIIHRDLKPDNVVLEGKLQKPLLVDFGIAKAAAAGEDLTEQGVLIGTPAYMSPEQASGDEIDHRSDIYSLGVLAYRLLTGKLPFDGSTSQAIIVQHVANSATPVRVLNPAVPRELANAVMKCMSKDPADRYQTAYELSADLATVKFLPDPITARAPRDPKRDTKVTATAGTIALIVGLLAGASLFSRGETPATTAIPEPTVEEGDSLVMRFLRLAAVFGANRHADDERLMARDLFADSARAVVESYVSTGVTEQREHTWAALTDRGLAARLAAADPNSIDWFRWSGGTRATLSWADSSGCGLLGITTSPQAATWQIVELRITETRDC